MLCPTVVQYRKPAISVGPRQCRRGPNGNNEPVKPLEALDHALPAAGPNPLGMGRGGMYSAYRAQSAPSLASKPSPNVLIVMSVPSPLNHATCSGHARRCNANATAYPSDSALANAKGTAFSRWGGSLVT